jgi:hypothetical protein
MLRNFLRTISPTVQVLAPERTIYPIYNVLLNSHVFVATSFGHRLELNIHIEDFNCGCSDMALIQILNANDQVARFSVELVSNVNCKQNYGVIIPDCENFELIK